MKLNDSQSEKNLLTAFVNESGARTKYLIYALQAKQEGHNEISELFYKMAENEMEHSKVWFNFIYGKTSTLDNLKDAAASENDEWKHMYPQFANIAKDEGHEDLALMFEKIASIESDHERRFTEAMLMLENRGDEQARAKGSVEESYCCIFCGYISETSLANCPVCLAKNSFTEI